MAGASLVFSKSDYKTQKGLDESRAKEWNSFDAAVHLPDALLQELIDEGHPATPTQWIETDKKAHMKRPGMEHVHEPELTSLG